MSVGEEIVAVGGCVLSGINVAGIDVGTSVLSPSGVQPPKRRINIETKNKVRVASGFFIVKGHLPDCVVAYPASILILIYNRWGGNSPKPST
jgi:hypothetical protein